MESSHERDDRYQRLDDQPLYDGFNRLQGSPQVGFVGERSLGSSEETRTSSDNVLMHRVPERVRDWHHVDDLDSFFRRVYRYHQNNGYKTMILRELAEILQFVFLVMLSVLCSCGIDYTKLLASETVDVDEKNHKGQVVKVTLGECFYSFSEAWSRIHFFVGFFLFVAFLFLVGKIAYSIHSMVQYKITKEFFCNALKIPETALQNTTWDEVKKQLMEVQLQQRMCVHKDILTSLDIYQRILRHQNYLVALVNQCIVPVKYDLPFIGELTFFTKGYEFNLNVLLFWGSHSLLQNVNADVLRQPHRKKEIIADLEKKIMYLSIINFIFMPFIFLYQVLNSLGQNIERVKNEPGSLTGRCWSHYGRLYLRHYNELDHELSARLNRAYKHSMSYLGSFSSPALAIIASTGMFFASSIFGVLLIISMYDDDFLRVEHVINLFAITIFVITITKNFIPDENLVWVPQLLMERIVTHIHYLPESWTGKFHTTQVRDEFSRLFQFKFVHILEELVSPLVVPFVLLFSLRGRAKKIVDFFHMFTVSVEGIGNVCSFAQMDIKQHGSPSWQPSSAKPSDEGERNEMSQCAPDKGRTELSLMHFAYTNPDWQPPKAGAAFLSAVKQMPRTEGVMGPLPSVAEVGGLDNSMNSLNLTGQNRLGLYTGTTVAAQGGDVAGYALRGVNGSLVHMEGPMTSSATAHDTSMHQSSLHTSMQTGIGEPYASNAYDPWQAQPQIAYAMGQSCLYLRGLNNQRRQQNRYYDDHVGQYPGPTAVDVEVGHLMQNVQESSTYDPHRQRYQRTPSPPPRDPFHDAMSSRMDMSGVPPTNDSIASQYQNMLYGASSIIQQQQQVQPSSLNVGPQLEPIRPPAPADDTPLLQPSAHR